MKTRKKSQNDPAAPKEPHFVGAVSKGKRPTDGQRQNDGLIDARLECLPHGRHDRP